MGLGSLPWPTHGSPMGLAEVYRRRLISSRVRIDGPGRQFWKTICAVGILSGPSLKEQEFAIPFTGGL